MAEEIRMNVAGVGNSLQWTSEETLEPGSWEEGIDFTVQPECEALCVVLTSGGEFGLQKGASGADFRLTSQDGERIGVFMRAEKGQLLFLVQNPVPGKWHMQLWGNRNSDIQVNATALKKGWLQRLMSHRLTCRICKYLLKAIIAAILMNIAPYILGVKGVALLSRLPQHVLNLLEILRNAIGCSPKILNGILDIISDSLSDRIDEIMRKICAFLNLCPATA